MELNLTALFAPRHIGLGQAERLRLSQSVASPYALRPRFAFTGGRRRALPAPGCHRAVMPCAAGDRRCSGGIRRELLLRPPTIGLASGYSDPELRSPCWIVRPDPGISDDPGISGSTESASLENEGITGWRTEVAHGTADLGAHLRRNARYAGLTGSPAGNLAR